MSLSVPEPTARSRSCIECWCAARTVSGFKSRTFRRAAAVVIAICLAAALNAQATLTPQAQDKELPNAPRMDSASRSSGSATAAQETKGAIVGTVLDCNGDVLEGARVAISAKFSGEVKISHSGSNGEFKFDDLPSGTYKLKVTGAGMGVFSSADIPLRAGEVHFVPQIVLPVAPAAAEVTVNGDRDALAEEQAHIALQQRVLGVVPNFYTAFDWSAPSLEPKQKFELAVRSVSDPISFLSAGMVAGLEQANNTYAGYGQEGMGFTKRFGAAYANGAAGRMLSSAALPSLFHQDPRYFYKGTGSKASRAFYAIAAAVISRGDDGRWQPNYSHVLGNFAAGGISNLYYPPADRGLSLTLANGLIDTAANAGTNLIREFALKRLTKSALGNNGGNP